MMLIFIILFCIFIFIMLFLNLINKYVEVIFVIIIVNFRLSNIIMIYSLKSFFYLIFIFCYLVIQLFTIDDVLNHSVFCCIVIMIPVDEAFYILISVSLFIYLDDVIRIFIDDGMVIVTLINILFIIIILISY